MCVSTEEAECFVGCDHSEGSIEHRVQTRDGHLTSVFLQLFLGHVHKRHEEVAFGKEIERFEGTGKKKRKKRKRKKK